MIIRNQYNININDIDGLRVSENDGWWLIRASNTQPAIVVRCESLSKMGLDYQIESLMNELRKVNFNFAQNIFLKTKAFLTNLLLVLCRVMNKHSIFSNLS